MLVPSASQRKRLASATRRYAETLAANAPAMSYLHRRGFSLASVALLRLGLVPESAPEPGHEAVRGHLAIPYLTPAGVVGMRFRAPPGSSSGAKYWGPPGQPARLYQPGACLGREGDALVICEGELDAASAWLLGGGEWAAVGVPGANAWRPHWAAALEGWQRKVLVPDNDDAGRALAAAVRAEWPDALVVPVESDVNDAAVQRPDKLRAAIAAALKGE